MIEIEHKRHTDLSAETVWEEVRHYDRVLNWVPRGDESRITVKGKGIGMIRDIELATQGYVQHRLVALITTSGCFPTRSPRVSPSVCRTIPLSPR